MREALRTALKDLLEKLERIGVSHEELYDSEVREGMSAAILRGFVDAEAGYDPPASYGMFAPEANVAVQSALREYIAAARAATVGLDAPARLAAFQDEAVATNGQGQYFDDFFGWVDIPPPGSR